MEAIPIKTEAPVAKKGQPSEAYLAELAQLRAAPLSDLGRRILVRQAMLSKDGNVGAKALAKALKVTELTVWRFLKSTDSCWYERYSKNPVAINFAMKLCKYLKVDHSWLFHCIDYGDLGEVNFNLIRANMWRLPR